ALPIPPPVVPPFPYQSERGRRTTFDRGNAPHDRPVLEDVTGSVLLTPGPGLLTANPGLLTGDTGLLPTESGRLSADLGSGADSVLLDLCDLRRRLQARLPRHGGQAEVVRRGRRLSVPQEVPRRIWLVLEQQGRPVTIDPIGHRLELVQPVTRRQVHIVVGE